MILHDSQTGKIQFSKVPLPNELGDDWTKLIDKERGRDNKFEVTNFKHITIEEEFFSKLYNGKKNVHFSVIEMK